MMAAASTLSAISGSSALFIMVTMRVAEGCALPLLSAAALPPPLRFFCCANGGRQPPHLVGWASSRRALFLLALPLPRCRTHHSC
jgi:hypothetical protein